MELKNERSSLEKKIQVSPSFAAVSLTPYSVCWAPSVILSQAQEALTPREAEQVLCEILFYVG